MGLLTAFWILPFTTGSAYMTDMKYEGRPSGANDSYWRMFFPLDVTLDRIIFLFALIGFLSSLKRRHLTGAWMGITIVALGVHNTYIARASSFGSPTKTVRVMSAL